MDINNDLNTALSKLNISSLDSATDILPSSWTSDWHRLQAAKYFKEENDWLTFHHLSLTHCHLIQHRLRQKLGHLLRDQPSKISVSESEKFSKLHLQSPTKDGTIEMIRMLPSDWTVVQITCSGGPNGVIPRWKQAESPDEVPSVFVSRVRCGSSPSLIIQEVTGSTGSEMSSLVGEMSKITKEIKIITSYFKESQTKYHEKKEELNRKIKNIVKGISKTWLKNASYLLTGSLPPAQEKQLSKIITDAAQKYQIDLDHKQLELLNVTVGAPNDLSSESSAKLRASIAKILGKSIRIPSVAQFTKNLTEDQRVIEIQKITRNPFILILDKNIVTLPWEMITVVSGQPVTRMPNLASLSMLYQYHSSKEESVLVKGADPAQGFYILDPDNNLPRTQERLKQHFAATPWEGIIGKIPSQETFCDIFTNQDISVYVGHGSGVKYIPYRVVESIDCHSLVFLYGCSSSAMSERGKVPDPWGTVINYLVAFCPCIVGMQWDVMDKDTDLLTMIMINAIRGENVKNHLPSNLASTFDEPPSSIPLLVSMSRPICSWYMISAALVVYGLPIHLTPKS